MEPLITVCRWLHESSGQYLELWKEGGASWEAFQQASLVQLLDDGWQPCEPPITDVQTEAGL